MIEQDIDEAKKELDKLLKKEKKQEELRKIKKQIDTIKKKNSPFAKIYKMLGKLEED